MDDAKLDEIGYARALVQIQAYAKAGAPDKFSVEELTFIATARFLGTDAQGEPSSELLTGGKGDNPIARMIVRGRYSLPYEPEMRAAVLAAVQGVDPKVQTIDAVKAAAALAKTSVQALALKGAQTINTDPDKAATLIDALPAEAALVQADSVGKKVIK